MPMTKILLEYVFFKQIEYMYGNIHRTCEHVIVGKPQK